MSRISIVNTETETAHVQTTTVSAPVEGRWLVINIGDEQIRGIVQDVEQHVSIIDEKASERLIVYLADITSWLS